MANYVYSTLSANVAYVVWDFKPDQQVARIKHRITIKGGAGVAENKHLITPKGLVTQVSDSDLALLRENPVFKRQEDRGFLKVESTKTQKNIEKAISDMEGRDNSAPITPQDFELQGLKVEKEDDQIVVKNPERK
jgi:hypothetical protein